MSSPQTTPPKCYTLVDLRQEMEARHPGFAEQVERARARLHARYPDPAQRRQFVLSHFVNVENLPGVE